MPAKAYAFIFCLVVLTTGCSSNDTAQRTLPTRLRLPVRARRPTGNIAGDSNTAAVKAKIDTCSLLTSDDSGKSRAKL